jgi:hypothetical protein
MMDGWMQLGDGVLLAVMVVVSMLVTMTKIDNQKVTQK